MNLWGSSVGMQFQKWYHSLKKTQNHNHEINNINSFSSLVGNLIGFSIICFFLSHLKNKKAQTTCTWCGRRWRNQPVKPVKRVAAASLTFPQSGREEGARDSRSRFYFLVCKLRKVSNPPKANWAYTARSNSCARRESINFKQQH